MSDERDRPRVAVTTTILPEGGEYRKPQLALYSNYVEVLDRMGLTVLLLTTAHGPDALRSLMDDADGLVLSGGYDIDPARYGEEPTDALGVVSPARDEMEFLAVELALARELPVLGICRGHQLLNVHFGGTLYQDIDSQLDGSSHQQTADWGQHHHSVAVEPDTLIERCLGLSTFEINSFHHQAVKDVGQGLRVGARSDDGLVESIEATNGRWVLGVQWHPERHEAHSEEADPNRCVFRAFREAVLERSGQPA